MPKNGQTIDEAIDMLKELKSEGLIFTNYKMTAYMPDGSKLEIKYDVKNDARFNGGAE